MHVTLVVDHNCDLACTYCYAGAKLRRRMPAAVMEPAIDLAFSGLSPKISFFGGEPLLAFDEMKHAVSYAQTLQEAKSTNPVRFDVTTNGTRLLPEIVDFLAEHGFRVVVSLDGSREAHEATRPFPNGRSSYDKIVGNLGQAIQTLPDIETQSVIDPLNVDELVTSFDAIVDLGVRRLHFSINYSADWNEANRQRLDSALKALSRRYVERYREGLVFGLNLFDSKIMAFLKGGYAQCDVCPFGDGEIAVAPSGFIYPCERLVAEDTEVAHRIGHVDAGLDVERIRALNHGRNELDTDCQDCEIQGRCRYWCGCVNIATTGHANQTSGLLCHIERQLIQRADEAASALFEANDPTFLMKFYGPVSTRR